MLDPEPPTEPVTGPVSRAVGGFLRRLVVVGICAGVTLATVTAVQRAAGQAPPGRSSAATATAAQPDRGSTILQSGSGLPTLGERHAPDGRGEVADGGAAGQVPSRPADAIDGLLGARAAAVRDGDRAAWLAGLAPVAEAPASEAAASEAVASEARLERFRTAQGRLFDRLRSLRPASWTYQVAGGYPLPAERRAGLGGVAWLADVQLDYQLIAGGPTVRRQQFLTVVRRAGNWLIADDTDGSTGRDVWDLGPIAHAVSPRCLVIGASSRRSQVEQLAAECAGPARTVDDAWGRSWPRRTVLTVPDALPQLAVLLGRTGTGHTVDTAGLEKTAAVTTGPSDGGADAVLINGAAFDQLSAVGRRVVLTHELVHVATRATGSRSAPTWLAEGYADYVAYAGTGLSARQVVGDSLDAVQAGRPPTALPAAGDFDAAGDQAATAYGGSWVAARLIAGKAGDARRMKAFYQRAAATEAGPAGLDAALREVGLGDMAVFVGLWQARLRELAQ